MVRVTWAKLRLAPELMRAETADEAADATDEADDETADTALSKAEEATETCDERELSAAEIADDGLGLMRAMVCRSEEIERLGRRAPNKKRPSAGAP